MNDTSVPAADDKPVNETAEMLHWQIEHTETTVKALTGKIAKAEEQLAEDRRALASTEAHLRRLETLALIVDGRPPIPAPRDVCEYPDGSIRIGVLVFQHPGPNASEDDLRYFAASMRAIYDVTTPAATHAIQEANAKRHVTEQATVETGAFPQVPPADRPFTVGPINPDAAKIWGHVKAGQTVRVHWVGGGGIEGLVRYLAGDRLVVETADADYELNPDPTDIEQVEVVDSEVRDTGNGAGFYACDHETTDDPGHGKHCPRKTDEQLHREFGFAAKLPADVDQTTVLPAATTLPDEAVRTDG
jgi:hypothetical protein